MDEYTPIQPTDVRQKLNQELVTMFRNKQKCSDVLDEQSLKFKDLKIQNDIFSISFASFVDPDKIQQGQGTL